MKMKQKNMTTFMENDMKNHCEYSCENEACVCDHIEEEYLEWKAKHVPVTREKLESILSQWRLEKRDLCHE